jgi:hypothetical protein
MPQINDVEAVVTCLLYFAKARNEKNIFTLLLTFNTWSPSSTCPFSLGLSSTAGTLEGITPCLYCCN